MNCRNTFSFIIVVIFFPLLTIEAFGGSANVWLQQWPDTDFSSSTVDLNEIQSGGPGKDGIPAIDHPKFVTVTESSDLAGDEPVIGLVSGDVAKAYPLRILIWHEIVNDWLNSTPVTVTYCPLCNTSIVYDRRIAGKLLDFGTTGNLRHSDLVMYDRQTESWWQQFTGDAIVGQLAGKKLKILTSRLESFDEFRRRAPRGQVLTPNDPHARDYGANPYVGYDRSPFPFLFKGKVPKGVAPMMRVVAIENIAFTLPLLREKASIKQDTLVLSWTPGQSSALDNRRLSQGRDVGNVRVTRQGRDIPYIVTFAFAFFAFNPDGVLFTRQGPLSASSQVE